MNIKGNDVAMFSLAKLRRLIEWRPQLKIGDLFFEDPDEYKVRWRFCPESGSLHEIAPEGEDVICAFSVSDCGVGDAYGWLMFTEADIRRLPETVREQKLADALAVWSLCRVVRIAVMDSGAKTQTSLDAVLAAKAHEFVQYFSFVYPTVEGWELDFDYQGPFWVDGDSGNYQWCYNSFEEMLEGFVEETGKTFREMLSSLPYHAVDIIIDRLFSKET